MTGVAQILNAQSSGGFNQQDLEVIFYILIYLFKIWQCICFQSCKVFVSDLCKVSHICISGSPECGSIPGYPGYCARWKCFDKSDNLKNIPAGYNRYAAQVLRPDKARWKYFDKFDT